MSFREVTNGINQGSFQGNDSGNAPVMLMLGGFKFSLNTAVFQQLNRSTAYRWTGQERVGQFDALQFTGPGEERLSLPGVIYPDFRGGNALLESLRTVASDGRPLQLIAATGQVLGLWVILSVEETQTAHKPDGTPLKQEFVISLRKFGNDANL